MLATGLLLVRSTTVTCDEATWLTYPLRPSGLIAMASAPPPTSRIVPTIARVDRSITDMVPAEWTTYPVCPSGPMVMLVALLGTGVDVTA